eukprot:m.258485 g.258485  ORF g.258485 m.258485 type:complete len:131 (+) comp19192_c1_seq8:96-488(+)
MPSGPTEVLSSLTLQVAFVLNAWYFALFFLAEFAIFIFKDYALPYRASDWSSEFALLWVFAVVEVIRIHFGVRGNLTEQKTPMLVSLAFSFPSLMVYLFFLLWQTYVSALDAALFDFNARIEDEVALGDA